MIKYLSLTVKERHDITSCVSYVTK